MEDEDKELDEMVEKVEVYVEKEFENIVKRYENDHHEFDEPSKKVMHDFFTAGFHIAMNIANNGLLILGREIKKANDEHSRSMGS